MIEGSASNARVALSYGMIGGGSGAFIGDVHRKAINLDGLATLRAGCFSRDYKNTLETGAELGVEEDRLYQSMTEMAEKESQREDKIDFVVIVTPNYAHYEACKAFLEKGINVVCDKPLCFTVEEAEELDALAKKNNLLFCVTYTYTGYPAVKQIKNLIAKGEIGDVRFVNAEYPQEWLAVRSEDGDNKQAAWRTDKKLAGISNCVGDIGSHVENMVSYTTGLRIKAISARLDKMVEGRELDDNATIMVEYEGGAKGVYWSSQIAVGYNNALKIRIFGSKGTIEWEQEEPNSFKFVTLGNPMQIWARGRDSFAPAAQKYSRIPSGHTEGYLESFANIYKTYILALAKVKAGGTLTEEDKDFPCGHMGTDGVRFINKCVESSDKNSQWVNF